MQFILRGVESEGFLIKVNSFIRGMTIFNYYLKKKTKYEYLAFYMLSR